MRKIKINAFLIIKSCRCSAISPEKNRVIAHYLVSKILHSSENHHVVFLDFYGIALGIAARNLPHFCTNLTKKHAYIFLESVFFVYLQKKIKHFYGNNWTKKRDSRTISVI